MGLTVFAIYQAHCLEFAQDMEISIKGLQCIFFVPA